MPVLNWHFVPWSRDDWCLVQVSPRTISFLVLNLFVKSTKLGKYDPSRLPGRACKIWMFTCALLTDEIPTLKSLLYSRKRYHITVNF